MRKYLEIGGAIATVVLIVFGVVAIALGVNGRNTVRDSLKAEQIVGTPDMTKAGIAAEAKAAGLPATIKLPTADIAGKAITTGALARDFAQYMRIHALEASGGLTYSQMPRYASADGKGTNDATKATKGANGQPLDNAARNTWVTETALSTALNASYLAENVALFGIVTGVAFLLTGIGFGILVLFGSLRGREQPAPLRQAQAGGRGNDDRSRRVTPAHLRRRAACRRPAFVSSIREGTNEILNHRSRARSPGLRDARRPRHEASGVAPAARAAALRRLRDRHRERRPARRPRAGHRHRRLTVHPPHGDPRAFASAARAPRRWTAS